MTLDKRWLIRSKSKKLLQAMSLRLIRHQAKSQKLEEALPGLHSMMRWDLKRDSSTAQKDKYKKEKKLFTQLLYTKSMSSIQDLKDFWLFSQVLQEKSLNKSDNKSIRKSQNGENKAKPKSFQEYCSSTKFICSTWNASHFWTELYKVRLLQLSF